MFNPNVSIIFLMIITLGLFACKTNLSIEELQASIEKSFESEEGRFACAFKNLQTGETILINENEKFHAASTMKTPVMIELYKQEAQGKFNISDSIHVKNEFYSIVDSSLYTMQIDDDSENILYEKVGQKLPIYELIYEMITKSSNLATNILIDLVDAKKVTQSMKALGANNIEVLRGVEDIKAYEQGLSNSTTAKDLMIIFEALSSDTLVSPESNEEMIEILTNQYWRDIIPKYLPDDVTIANKTGSITGVHHDSGLIFLPNGDRYILVLLSKEMKDFEAGTEMLARVSEMIYNQLKA